MELSRPLYFPSWIWRAAAALFFGFTGLSDGAEEGDGAIKGLGDGGKTASVWRIETGESTVFLAGSVHLLRSSDYPLPPVYDEAYEASDELHFEVDLGVSLDAAARKKFARAGFLPVGETIKDHVSEETYELLQEYLTACGIGGTLFDSMKPGSLAVVLASLEYIRKGALPHHGVDMVYYNRARKDGKPTAGFETMGFQMTLFDRLSFEKQERLLRETLEHMGDSEEVSERLIKAWREGDVAALDAMLASEMSKDEEMADVLLYGRNRSWIPKIVKLLEARKNAMVIVGAGHLVGKASVVELLEKRGYVVEQMRFEEGGRAGDGDAGQAVEAAAGGVPAAAE